MTENDNLRIDASRRSFVKKGVLASGGLALGLSMSSTSPAAAQDAGGKALMFNDEFRPGARFEIVSPVIEETPDVEAVEEQNIWEGTNTRVITYRNTNERVLFFPVQDAKVAQGELYEFSPHDLSVYHDDEGIVSVSFGDPGEDETETPDDLDFTDGGGKALVRTNNFYPDALFRIVSDVVRWTPRREVRESDIYSNYNTRFAEFQNANDEFLIYPAHAAEVERGALYQMRDEFDITEPGGALMTVDFVGVAESSVQTDRRDRGSSD